MSHAGTYLKKGIAIFNALEEGKPHSSITDWIEVLSSDRYEELSLDGIPELVESVNIQGHVGTTEAARAVRKKLKYGNVHRQIRALVILRALTENANHGFQVNWANAELVSRLKDMAQDVSEKGMACAHGSRSLTPRSKRGLSLSSTRGQSSTRCV